MHDDGSMVAQVGFMFQGSCLVLSCCCCCWLLTRTWAWTAVDAQGHGGSRRGTGGQANETSALPTHSARPVARSKRCCRCHVCACLIWAITQTVRSLFAPSLFLSLHSLLLFLSRRPSGQCPTSVGRRLAALILSALPCLLLLSRPQPPFPLLRLLVLQLLF